MYTNAELVFGFAGFLTLMVGFTIAMVYAIIKIVVRHITGLGYKMSRSYILWYNNKYHNNK